jgi:predicted nucleic acid-binding protein
MKTFIDTNIFVYSVSAAPDDVLKRRVAMSLLAEADIHLSLQVVQEFIHTCLRKKRIGCDIQALQRSARQMLAFPCHKPGAASVLRSLEIQQTQQISYWDAAIIAAALDLGCHVLYSEDLNHGQDYEGVKVINPFL